MKKTHALSLIAFCALLISNPAFGCGDKLLRLSRIHRLHQINASYTVLIFSRPASLLENASSMRLEKPFKNEGYQIIWAKTDREVELAIQAGAVDLVIADIDDAGYIRNVAGPRPLPLIVPVVPKGDRARRSDAKFYPAAITLPTKPGKFLDALDRALTSESPSRDPKFQTVGTFSR